MKNYKAAGLTRREQYEQKQRHRSILVAALSTIFVIVAIVIFVPMTPGWEKVQKSFFNGVVLSKTFPKLLNAFTVNIMIFAWSAPAIAVLGLMIALARDAKSPALFPLAHFWCCIYRYFSWCSCYFNSLFNWIWNTWIGSSDGLGIHHLYGDL